MTYSRFEDLPVWQQAITLAEGVDDFTRSMPKGTLSWSQKDQIERAALSVSNNIAEGFERGSTNDLIKFIYIARGSAGEVRSMLLYFRRRPYLQRYIHQIDPLIPLSESCAKQLKAWAKHLQKSEIKGERHQ